MKLEGFYRKQAIALIVFIVTVVSLAVFLILVITRDLPEVNAEVTYKYEGKLLTLDNIGLEQGQAGVGSSTEVKAIYGGDEMAPIASLAKVITSVVAMQKESDLEKIITLDEKDLEFYREAVRTGGSRLKVEVGEQLSLKQMHEALLIVSANNIADSLVYHLFDNQDDYRAAAEEWLNDNGLKNTKIGVDASGLDPSTMSSPSDMIKIGQIVAKNSEISRIVRATTTSLPLEGEVENTNKLLGEGYYGIKTGNTTEAGSCLLFLTQHEGEEIIGILMGQPFNSTFDIAKTLVQHVKDNFSLATILSGTVVGMYDLPWGGYGQVVTSQEISAMTWGDIDVDIEIKPYRHGYYMGEVGTLKFADKETSLKLKSEISDANLFWRITHLNQLKW
ncbi:serine hydrolase [Ruminococcaceae bacterium OttesenSCG-928-A11]|nr:serine hydrolase [Ruminococcaceae bacterium OttesenSCG-928-A11]